MNVAFNMLHSLNMNSAFIELIVEIDISTIIDEMFNVDLLVQIKR